MHLFQLKKFDVWINVVPEPLLPAEPGMSNLHSISRVELIQMP